MPYFGLTKGRIAKTEIRVDIVYCDRVLRVIALQLPHLTRSWVTNYSVLVDAYLLRHSRSIAN